MPGPPNDRDADQERVWLALAGGLTNADVA
jgi:hypothetical protein